jgi:threonine aldolase
MVNPLTSFFIGRELAGGEGNDRSGEIAARSDAAISNNKADSAQNVALAIAETLEQERGDAHNWRVYANRLNIHLAAHKMSEATLLAELKEANVNHPLATEEGFNELFDKMLADQYAEADQEMKSEGISRFEKKSREEVGGERADVK